MGVVFYQRRVRRHGLLRRVVDDARQSTRYRLDGVWKPLDARVETYRDKRGRVAPPTRCCTRIAGRSRREGLLWISTRWTAHDATNDSDALVRAGRSHRPIMARCDGDLFRPSQNGIVADRSARSRFGHRPLPDPCARRARRSTTRRSASANDWRGALPVSSYPFLAKSPHKATSLRQTSTVDPRIDSTYLGAHWYSHGEPCESTRCCVPIRV